MSENQPSNTDPQHVGDPPASDIEAPAVDTNTEPQSANAPLNEATADAQQVDSAAEDPESTIGTGTSMALGCVAGTILLIGFGLLFLFISTLR